MLVVSFPKDEKLSARSWANLRLIPSSRKRGLLRRPHSVQIALSFKALTWKRMDAVSKRSFSDSERSLLWAHPTQSSGCTLRGFIESLTTIRKLCTDLPKSFKVPPCMRALNFFPFGNFRLTLAESFTLYPRSRLVSHMQVNQSVEKG